MRNPKGFTLIELLIVVAIIAILAAIAVPNFLEAQTRAKVSRAVADMRTIATAVESYRVDYNKYPTFSLLPQPFTIPSVPITGTVPPCLSGGGATLTTPVAYITSIPSDPFGPVLPDDDFTFGGATSIADGYYYNTRAWFQCRGFAWRVFSDINESVVSDWVLQSKGPDKYFSKGSVSGIPGADELDRPQRYQYDPTNGTLSVGNIIRTGPQ